MRDSTLITYQGLTFLPSTVTHSDSSVDSVTYNTTNGLVTSQRAAGQERVTYTYGNRNQIATVTGAGVVGVTNTLDSLGRVTKTLYGTVAGDTTTFTYDPVTMSVASTREPNVGLTTYQAQDDMGNVNGLFKDHATVTETVTYGDWGLPSVTGDTTNRFTWKGLSYDPDVGLTYMRSRWYDPNIGRFVSEDPLGLGGGINPYVFANNDPINGFDPTGMSENIGCTLTGYQYNWVKSGDVLTLDSVTPLYDCDGGGGDNGVRLPPAAPVDGVAVGHGGGGTGSASSVEKQRICKENPVNKTGALNLQANMQTASTLAKQFWTGLASGNVAQATGAVAVYINLIHTGGAWDPKNWPGVRSSTAQSTNVAAGNINFGATCGQFGGNTWLGGEVCQYGAGMYGKSTGNYGSPLLSPYHGDWPLDNMQIRQGLAIAKGGC